MGNFETHNLKTIETCGEIWKPLKMMEIWKLFETHNLKTIEYYGEIWKHFETDHLKTIETYGRILKHYGEIWKPLKPMGKFENTLKP